jgi:CBS domain-containing protein
MWDRARPSTIEATTVEGGAAMKVGELMQRRVVTVREEQSLKELAECLFDHGISGVPVVGADGNVVGVASEADLLHKQGGREGRRGGVLARLRPAAPDTKAGARTVGEAMTSPALTVAPESTVAAAARLMLDHGVNRLPVVGRDGALLGIVTRADLVRAFGRADHAIAAEIRDDILKRVLWVDPAAFTVRVERGEVELVGELETEGQIEVLTALVEKVPGVVSVTTRVGHRDREPGRLAGRR